MDSSKKEFIDFIVESGALKFGDFTLKSKRKSPFFFNMGDLSSGAQLLHLANGYAKTIHEQFISKGQKVDVLFGPAYKGIPLAAATVTALSWHYSQHDIRFAANRKEAKDHGETGAILGGPIKEGDNIVIVEDVTTTGKSIQEVMPFIEACGNVNVIGEVIALDRRERGEGTTEYALKLLSRRQGFPVHAIITMDDVIDCLYTYGDRKVITDEIYERLKAYYAEYGGID